MACEPPPINDSGLPINVGVVSMEPRKLHNQWQTSWSKMWNWIRSRWGLTRRMSTGLVGDSAQPVAIQGPDRHGSQQRLVAQSQLLGHLPTDEAGVNSRINQRD